MSVYAYSEAARLLDQTIKVQKILDPDSKEKICDLILDLCDALYPIPNVDRIIDIEGPAAFTLAKEMNDSPRAIRAFDLVFKSMTTRREGENVKEWLEKADQIAVPGTIERALVDSRLGMIKWRYGQMHEGEELLLGALEQARRHNDQHLVQQVIFSLLAFHVAPQHTSENMKLYEELWESLQHGGLNAQGPLAMLSLFEVPLIAGQRKQAEKFYNDIRVVAEQTGEHQLEHQVRVMECVLEIINGRLEEAVKKGEALRERNEQITGQSAPGVIPLFGIYKAFLYLGRPYEIPEELLRMYEARIVNCLILAYHNRKDESFKIIDRYVLERPNVGTEDDFIPAYVDAILLESSVLIRHTQTAEILMNRFKDTDVRTGGFRNVSCVRRLMGDASFLLERYDEAREHYNEAIEVCKDMRFRPESALSRLGLAELLFDHYPDEKAEALEHLDFAIKEFREMKMQPSLERALRRKDILKA